MASDDNENDNDDDDAAQREVAPGDGSSGEVVGAAIAGPQQGWRAWSGSRIRSLIGTIGREFGSAAMNLLYPPSCRLCRVPLHGPDHEGRLAEFFCQSCDEGLPRLAQPCCRVCSESYAAMPAPRRFLCSNCEDRSFHFEFVLAPFQAAEGVREMVHRFKYSNEMALKAALGRMLECAFEDERWAGEDLAQWWLVPVPLHHVRLREREYNQAWELCRVLGIARGIRHVEALRRVIYTTQQATLTRGQRLANLRSAFVMRSAFTDEASPLRGQQVLLVDDVFTTGTTAEECARVLRREGGVEKVVVLTVARG